MTEDDLTAQIEASTKAAIEALDAEIVALEAKRRALLIEFQCTCSHREIVERDYVPSEYGSAQPPARVCTACGLAENGWHCGYKLLSFGDEEYVKKARVVSQKEFAAYQRGRIHNNGDFVRPRDKRAHLRQILLGKVAP